MTNASIYGNDRFHSFVSKNSTFPKNKPKPVVQTKPAQVYSLTHDTVEISYATLKKYEDQQLIKPIGVQSLNYSEEDMQRLVESLGKALNERTFSENLGGIQIELGEPRVSVIDSTLLYPMLDHEACDNHSRLSIFANLDRLKGQEVWTSYLEHFNAPDLSLPENKFWQPKDDKGRSLPYLQDMDVRYDFPVSDMTGLQAQFQDRVNELLEKSGVSFSADDQLNITVNSAGVIVIDGIKDEATRSTLSDILNSDTELADSLYREALYHEYGAAVNSGNFDQLAVFDKGFVESYVKDKLGYAVSCDEVFYMHEMAWGGDQNLAKLLEDDPMLKEQMFAIAYFKEAGDDEFKASWSFNLGSV